MIIALELGGRSYEYDPADLSIRQAAAIEEYTGRPFGEFDAGVIAGRPDRVQCRVALPRSR